LSLFAAPHRLTAKGYHTPIGLRLVVHVVKEFDNVYEDQDDLISIGSIGMIKAINAFDPQKGTKLATFAAKCVENTA